MHHGETFSLMSMQAGYLAIYMYLKINNYPMLYMLYGKKASYPHNTPPNHDHSIG